MLNSFELFFLGLFFCECFEFYWQKGEDFIGYTQNLAYFFSKGVIVFIVLHPTLYVSIFAQILFDNFSIFACTITLLKAVDLGFKIFLLDKLEKGVEVEFLNLLVQSNHPVTLTLKLVGPLSYLILFYVAYAPA
ncbi:MAG: hypothetical protein PHN38_06205 [Sulfurospirillaceae bacterium]|nr:hypothetical protein [Sulfurospirillaceae bacterium]MDD3462254.1 hypothetical protein [Sulfurospirillaceae bacterium]